MKKNFKYKWNIKYNNMRFFSHIFFFFSSKFYIYISKLVCLLDKKKNSALLG